ARFSRCVRYRLNQQQFCRTASLFWPHTRRDLHFSWKLERTPWKDGQGYLGAARAQQQPVTIEQNRVCEISLPQELSSIVPVQVEPRRSRSCLRLGRWWNGCSYCGVTTAVERWTSLRQRILETVLARSGRRISRETVIASN